LSDVVIRAEGLGKKYLIGHEGKRESYVALRDVVARNLKGFVRSAGDVLSGRQLIVGDEVEEFWALKDVGFEVKRGEVLGIIGRNGAGKSTLLKILSRITEPSAGRVEIKGRVASLLEVGTGFHPELTGRENVYLNGAILGMSRAEIKRKFDEIVAFAEVEKFLDTPVKRYSSGMYVRLAFAVAAHLEPEILVVDEVLAVGDAEFQKKCLGKMGEAASGGRTVLLVSHNMVAVRSLCRRCLVLKQGRLLHDGPTDNGIATFQKQTVNSGAVRLWNDRASAPGNDVVKIAKVAVASDSSDPNQQITMKSPFRVDVNYFVNKNNVRLHLMFHLFNEHGVLVLTTAPPSMEHKNAAYSSTCEFTGGLLNEGTYSLKLQVVEDNWHIIYVHENIASFDVIDFEPRAEGWMGREPGVVQPEFPWRISELAAS
jgi:lipopolysaccharide transport system ATP-binding protein